jgi:hypothetical protein
MEKVVLCFFFWVFWYAKRFHEPNLKIAKLHRERKKNCPNKSHDSGRQSGQAGE